MAGLCCLDGDFGSFQIANFPHHHHIRVLPQEGAQGAGEGEPRLGVDLHLVDAGQVDLHRVFGGGDVYLGGVENIEAGIERDRFARAGGAGHQDHPLWLGEGAQVLRLLPVIKAELLDIKACRRGVEQTDNDLLPPHGGQGINPHIHRLVARQLQLDAAILWQPPLGNIEPRHDLEAGGEAVGEVDRRRSDFMQNAIDTKAHPILELIGLEVQVGGAALDGIHQNLVDVLDDGGIVIGGIDALVQPAVLVGDLEIRNLGFVDILHAEGVVFTLQQLADGGGELILLHQQGFSMKAEAEAKVLQRRDIGRIRHGDIEGVALSVDGQDVVFLNQLLIEVLLRDLGQIEGGKIQQRYPILQLAKIGERLAVEDLVLYQKCHKGFALGLGLAQIALGVLFTNQ